MNKMTSRIDQPVWELVEAMTYIVTADDLEDGRNKLGIEFKGPLDVPLCHGCDTPVGSDGICESCCCIHTDIARKGAR